MTATRNRLREITEMSTRPDIRHGLSIDHQRRTGLCTSDQLHHASMQLRFVHFQEHLFGLALTDERKLERVAWRALFLVGFDCRYPPEIISGIESADVFACPGNHFLGGDARKHRVRAHPQAVAYSLGNGRPRKMYRGVFGIFLDQWLKI